MEAMFQPPLVYMWVIVGIIAGLISRAVFSPKKGAMSMSSAIKWGVIGLVGAFLSVLIALRLSLPMAAEIVGIVIYAIVGTLILAFILSKVAKT